MKTSRTIRNLIVGGTASLAAALAAMTYLNAQDSTASKASFVATPVTTPAPVITPATAPAAPPATIQPAVTAASAAAPAITATTSPAATLTGRREVRVEAVAFSGTPGTDNVQGSTNGVTVRIEPNKSGKPLVGISEEFVSGTGSEWRAAAWMAAFNATHAANFQITDVEVLFMMEGKIDGPSAGLLMTATLVALMNDTPVLPHTIMTGAINPDGTSGPVGGIPQKMEGAAKSGYKRFGFPLGQRQDTDLRTGENVDVVSLAKKLGMEAVELKDLSQAYKFLTGKDLPHPDAASEADMELDEAAADQVKSRVKAWIGQVNQQDLVFKKRIKEAKAAGANDQFFELSGINFRVTQVQKLMNEALRLRDSGELFSAWRRLTETACHQVYANMVLDVFTPFLRHDWEGMHDALEAASGAARVRLEATLDDLKARCKKPGLGARIAAAANISGFVQGYICQDLADSDLARAYEVIEQFQKKKLTPRNEQHCVLLVQAAMKPLLNYSVAQIMAQVTEDTQKITLSEGNDIEATPARAASLGRGYAAAAGAAMAGLQTLVVNSRARSRNDGDVNAAKAEIQNEDFNFSVVELATSVAEHADKAFKGDEEVTGLFRLAFGAFSFIQGGSMTNRYYSLGTKIQNGQVTIERKRALGFQLEAAKQRALQAAGRSKSTLGFIPASARAQFQHALSIREGGDMEKLEALEAFWWSTFWSEAAVQMAGK